MLLECRSVRMGLRVRLVAIAPPAVPRDLGRPMVRTVAIAPPDRLRSAKTELRQGMVALAPPIPMGPAPGSLHYHLHHNLHLLVATTPRAAAMSCV